MKKIVSLILILCLALSLFSCGAMLNPSSMDEKNQLEKRDLPAVSPEDTENESEDTVSVALESEAAREIENPKLPTEEKMKEEFKLLGIVKGVDDRIEIEVIESDYAYGIYWVLSSENTVFLDKNGSSVKRSSIEKGDKVEIVFGGQVMMSYPPQIVAFSVRIVE